MSAMFAAIGVGVSAGIIAIGGGFSGGRAPDIFDPPSSEDIWQVGGNIQNRTTLNYTLTSEAEASSLQSAWASMIFEENGKNWDVEFNVANGTNQVAKNTMTMSKELTREGQLTESFKPYFEPIQSSIFAVRDMEYGKSPKYLVVGAPWNEIFYQSSEVIVRVTGEEIVQTPAGSFDAFVLSYKLAEKPSKIWVAKEMPLPVKAEVYDSDDKLQYRYELVGAAGI
jgi:hypothetical protein